MVKRPAAVSDHSDSESDRNSSKRARTNEESSGEEEAPRRTQRQTNGKGKGKARANARVDGDDDLEEVAAVEEDVEINQSYTLDEDDEAFEERNADLVREQITNPKRKKKVSSVCTCAERSC